MWKPTQVIFCHSTFPLLIEVLRALESHTLFNQVNCYASCGNGSLPALMKYLGYSSAEIERFLTPYFRVDDEQSQEEIVAEVINDVFQHLTVGIPNLKQLYLLTAKKLYFSSYNLSKDEVVYFSADTHPTLNVKEAILLSIQGGYLEGESYLNSSSVEPVPFSCLLPQKRTLVLQTQLTRSLFSPPPDLLHRAAVQRLAHALFQTTKGIHLYLQVSTSREAATGLTYSVEDLVEKALQKIAKANKKLFYSKEIFE